MTDSPIYQDLHPWVDNVNYWFRNLGQGDKECMVVRSTRQIQNKIDLREVLCARETGQLPTNLIMFSLKPLDTTTSWDFQFSEETEDSPTTTSLDKSPLTPSLHHKKDYHSNEWGYLHLHWSLFIK